VSEQHGRISPARGRSRVVKPVKVGCALQMKPPSARGALDDHLGPFHPAHPAHLVRAYLEHPVADLQHCPMINCNLFINNNLY
jgi:hypothetical protein